MRILVIGGGGREHAIVWKLAQSASVEKIWCAPGNDGISRQAECVALNTSNVRATADLADHLAADLTIVGPELPLTLGVGDEFERRGRKLLGPAKVAAQLEGSKIFAKQFMQRHGIPTAEAYEICDDPVAAHAALGSVDWPLVIKAEGLCAGKGVLVTRSADEAAEFLERVMEKGEFGDAGKRVLLEEALAGQELSYIVLTDGKHFMPMAPARDHKRAFDNDEGPNTGGMGVFSVDDVLPVEVERQIGETIVRRTLDGLRAEGIRYRGFLYFGLMLTEEGPKVLEYNCRLGDPETEAVLLRADFDFAQACMQCALGSVESVKPKWSPAASVCVVVASKGYPNHPETGVEIGGLEDAAQVRDTVVFHAGTKRDGERILTNGGRVLVVSATGADLSAARRAAYAAVGKIRIAGSYHRTDIGRDGSSGSFVSKEPARKVAANSSKGDL
jgi:phosphoribosylamine---glycine ligase